MAGATNRSFKAAGIPRKAAAEIRLKAGGRLTLKSALDVAAKHGIDVPQKAHDFAAARDRKVALKTAKARRAERLTKSIGDASRISRDMRRKAAVGAQNVSAGVDNGAKRSKAGAMDTKPALSKTQQQAMSNIKAGRGHSVGVGTLKALRARGLVTFSIRAHKRRFGRTTDSVTVTVALTDAGKSA